MYLPPRQAEIVQMAKDTGRVPRRRSGPPFRRHAADDPQGSQRSVRPAAADPDSRRGVFPSGIRRRRVRARRKIAATEKDAIGQAAARLIPDKASLVHQHRDDHRGCVERSPRSSRTHGDHNNSTSPTGCGYILRSRSCSQAASFRGSDGGIVGVAAVDFIRQFKVDYAVIGTSAIDHDGALLDFDFREVKVAQAIMAMRDT